MPSTPVFKEMMSNPPNDPFATPDPEQVAQNEAIRQEQERAQQEAYQRQQAEWQAYHQQQWQAYQQQWAAYHQQQQAAGGQQQPQWTSQQWQGQAPPPPQHGQAPPPPQHGQPSPYQQTAPHYPTTYPYPGAYPPYQQTSASTPPMVITALVLGIVSILLFQPLGIVAIILGIVGLRNIKREHSPGRGVAIAGIVTGSIGTLILVAVITAIIVAVNVATPVDADVDQPQTVAAKKAVRGNCVDSIPETASGGLSYDLVPCSEPHAAELFGTHSPIIYPEYPATRSDVEAVATTCLDRSYYLNQKFDELGSENFEIFMTIPSKEDWSPNANRIVHCFVTPTSGQMQGSFRLGDVELIP